MRKFHDEPIGNPFGGPAYGLREDPVGGLVGAGLSAIASTAIGGLLGGGKQSAPAPTVTQPTVMPTPDDAAVQAAKRKSLAGQLQRRGRQSTILDDPTSTDLLGG